ncbi:hypothetical protein EVU94_05300 [Flavobacteriaceae bacterium 144Ye]|nr:hypothetical protein EVU94_05300 [Flavobacteriaceae bacterium 144Ye]
MGFVHIYIQELNSLVNGTTYNISKIEWWLLKYQDEYNRIKEEESNRFMYFIDDKWVRLPDYFDARTPNEKFLKIYNTLNEITDLHKHENYFKQEMAIYKGIKNQSEKVKEWLAKNEHLGAKKYFMFSLDNDYGISIERNDFRYTIEFTNIFNNLYWVLLEELNLKQLN